LRPSRGFLIPGGREKVYVLEPEPAAARSNVPAPHVDVNP
jgi:hypothetical protein